MECNSSFEIVQIGDDEIKAHRCFLAQHSDVFRTMFSQESMVEAEKGIVEIKDSDYQSVRAMLEYMYCGSTAMIENNVEGVLALAEKYAIKALKEFCGNYLASKINTANIGETATIGEMYSSPALIKPGYLFSSLLPRGHAHTSDRSRGEAATQRTHQQIKLVLQMRLTQTIVQQLELVS
ncbi:unnamed protein product [Toxocara canis]|uniref:BTB domain-containing protein n=1 Tax=Toxocara canis TaxID=6265 RepID=A0A183U7T6_TOXCA|nr:unnamed protein product [Toxocara canis]